MITAAERWGHRGKAYHDPTRGAVVFVGVGEVDVGDADGKLAGWDPEQQVREMQRRTHRLLEPLFEVPPEWVTGDRELDRIIRSDLLGLRKFPDSAPVHERVARLERQLGLGDWRARLAWAADRHVAIGTEKRYLNHVRSGGLLWAELGDTERARRVGDQVLRRRAGPSPVRGYRRTGDGCDRPRVLGLR